jgi:hypothetical protein
MFLFFQNNDVNWISPNALHINNQYYYRSTLKKEDYCICWGI